ncbi:MAG: 3-dehydroquinate synthase [Chitinophagaceae bacterium]|nr:MAG: 3-dehydroquinate synthase [Chitinophagaceae bacterium]
MENVLYIHDVLELEQKLTELTKGKKVFYLTEETVYLHVIKEDLKHLLNGPMLIVSPGEKNKNLQATEQICQFLLNNRADRHSVLVSIGGGVITDLGGFAASIYQRGIESIYIPTSLLGMCDAAIGGKTGVNFKHFKNQIGTFAFAESVLILPSLLETLPLKEFKSGVAEMLKHLLICNKQAFESFILPEKLSELTVESIKQAVLIKQEIVKSDFKESENRKKLNLGHTFGHALESYFLKYLPDEVPHGYAIAAGIIMESFCNLKLNHLNKKAFQQICQKIYPYFPHLSFPVTTIPEISDFMTSDKKNRKDNNYICLLSDIGSAQPEVLIDNNLIAEALRFYSNKNYQN